MIFTVWSNTSFVEWTDWDRNQFVFSPDGFYLFSMSCIGYDILVSY
jgi:hypothetical protein